MERGKGLSDDQWWEWTLQEDWDFTRAEVLALRAFVDGRTEIPETLTALMSTREDNRRLDNKPDRVGFLLCSVIEWFPHAHARLAKLLAAVLKMSAEEMGWTDEQKERFPDWHEEPRAGAICYDLWQDYEIIEDDRFCYRAEEGNTLEGSMRAWRDMNNFFAYWSLEPEENWELQRCLHNLRDALEKKIRPQGAATEHSALSPYDVDIQGMSPLLLVAGKEIYSRRRQRDAFPTVYPVDHERTDMNIK